MIGKVLGQYRILSMLGEGGMGVVYRARDQVLERDVALKFLRRDIGRKAREVLLREARAASALSHPSICTVFGVGEADGNFYIAMELVEGRPLSSVPENEALPFQTVLRYGSQIAGALAHAHGRNIIHRDLKGSNVIVTPEGLVKILDFGLARRVAAEAQDKITRTLDEIEPPAVRESPRSIGGTLPYMAPEVLRGEPGDQRSDLWALGVVLFEALSGRLPFQGRTAFEATSAILKDPPPPLPAPVPAGAAGIVLRCLAKDPALRYQRASEVQAALDAVLSASASPEPIADPRGPHTLVHRGTRHLDVRDGDVLLLVGTTKGAFLLRSTPRRARWNLAGPYFHGQAIYALAYDNRAGRHRLWASASSMIWGAFLRSSDDYGRTWTDPQNAPIRFPPDSGATLRNIWQICPGRPSEPNVIYCGVEPAALYASHDDGATWSLVRGLFDHPHRNRWMPGMGGLALHTILLDPLNQQRMYVAISAGGVYSTDDGGRNWRARNRGVRVMSSPVRYPEFGQCVHRIAMHPARPERLFLQNHFGLYHSEDHGETWQDIANGVPSDFGFAMTVHPRNPDCVYIVPMESDEFRCSPEGRLRVFRTRNAGHSWEPLTHGLPQRRAYETVLRDGMSADSLDPAGIYFGTRSGQLYASSDEGKTWNRIAEGLPPIVCVKSAVVGEAAVNRRPPRAAPAAAEPRNRK
jgi:serine/threonine protein kinase